MDIHKVLLVDDEEDIRTIGELSLSSVGGWTVELAAGGSEALEKARTHKPDVILLDVMMPGMDGPTTLEQLKTDANTATIPVIFITAKMRRADVNHLLQLGAAGVIGKPFDPMALPGRILAIAEQS